MGSGRRESALWSVRTAARRSASSLPPIRHRIVAYDYGIKENILRRLRQNGFGVTVVPATTTAEEVLALNPDGVFLSNGPGDPAALDYAHTSRPRSDGQEADLRNLSRPSSARLRVWRPHLQTEIRPSRRQSAGERFDAPGKSRSPRRITVSRSIRIRCRTKIEVTHVNLNDGTVEGMRHRELPIFSVQYHPEAAPGPHDASYFFQRFRAADRRPAKLKRLTN